MLPAGRSPIIFASAVMAPCAVERAWFSACTAWSTTAWKRASSRASSAGASERRSISIQASFGMAFTEVPPPTTLAL